MKYDPDIHHRWSIRLKDFDYSSNGVYFVTICTATRKPLFGEVSIDRVFLNECGGIARDEWIRTADVRPNVEIDEFVIMPNHIHGIITILPDDIDMQNRRGDPVGRPSPIIERNEHDPVGRPCVGNGDVRVSGKRVNHRLTPTLVSGSLGAIMAQYKSIVTKRIWKLTGSQTPVWQRNYYEHVIRNEKELDEIRQYIRTNPLNWDNDEENPKFILEPTDSKWGLYGFERRGEEND